MQLLLEGDFQRLETIPLLVRIISLDAHHGNLPGFTVQEVKGRIPRLVLVKAGLPLALEIDGIGQHQARGLAEATRFDEIPDLVCGLLSYGDLKRVELAVALTNQPKLLLMDEPTAGMEHAERQRLMDLISRIVRTRNIGALFIEHDMDVVFTYADRIIVLNRGEKIAEGTPDRVREEDYVREIYLGGAFDLNNA